MDKNRCKHCGLTLPVWAVDDPMVTRCPYCGWKIERD